MMVLNRLTLLAISASIIGLIELGMKSGLSSSGSGSGAPSNSRTCATVILGETSFHMLIGLVSKPFL